MADTSNHVGVSAVVSKNRINSNEQLAIEPSHGMTATQEQRQVQQNMEDQSEDLRRNKDVEESISRIEQLQQLLEDVQDDVDGHAHQSKPCSENQDIVVRLASEVSGKETSSRKPSVYSMLPQSADEALECSFDTNETRLRYEMFDRHYLERDASHNSIFQRPGPIDRSIFDSRNGIHLGSSVKAYVFQENLLQCAESDTTSNSTHSRLSSQSIFSKSLTSRTEHQQSTGSTTFVDSADGGVMIPDSSDDDSATAENVTPDHLARIFQLIVDLERTNDQLELRSFEIRQLENRLDRLRARWQENEDSINKMVETMTDLFGDGTTYSTESTGVSQNKTRSNQDTLCIDSRRFEIFNHIQSLIRPTHDWLVEQGIQIVFEATDWSCGSLALIVLVLFVLKLEGY